MTKAKTLTTEQRAARDVARRAIPVTLHVPAKVKGFTPRSFNALSVRLVTAAMAEDAANGATNAILKGWALSAAVGLTANALTMDGLNSMLQKAVGEERRVANAARMNKAGVSTTAQSIKACGATIERAFRALNRIAKAGQLARLVNGEALYTVSASIGGAGKAAEAATKREAAKGNKTAPKTPKPDKALDESVNRVKGALVITISEAVARVVSEGKAGNLTPQHMIAITSALAACRTKREAKARNVAASAAKEALEKAAIAA